LLPGAGAEITNCGSGSGSSSDSGSFLFTTDLKKFEIKKTWLLKKFLQIVTIVILLLKSKKVNFKVSYKLSRAGARAGAGVEIGDGARICSSAVPEPKEIFSSSQHCKITRNSEDLKSLPPKIPSSAVWKR
jgi:hypothetical protein